MRNFLQRHRAKCSRGYVATHAFLEKFAHDERGAVAVWVGLALITFVGCAGMAVDTTRGYMVKARLSQALDAAAVGCGAVRREKIAPD